jgi:transposase-like protein
MVSRFRHYRNLDQTEARFRRLLREFRFGTVSQVLAQYTHTISTPVTQALSA